MGPYPTCFAESICSDGPLAKAHRMKIDRIAVIIFVSSTADKWSERRKKAQALFPLSIKQPQSQAENQMTKQILVKGLPIGQLGHLAILDQGMIFVRERRQSPGTYNKDLTEK